MKRRITGCLRGINQKINRSEFAKKLMGGVFWSLSGSVLSRGMMMASNILVARILGKVSYGGLAIIQSTVVMAGIFAGFGIKDTCRKFIAALKTSDKEKTGRVMGLCIMFAVFSGGVIAVIMNIAAPFLAEKLFNSKSLVTPLRISSLLIFINGIVGAQMGIITGFECFRQDAVRGVISNIITVPLVMTGAYFRGINGVFTGLAVGGAINILLYYLFIRNIARKQGIRISYRSALGEMNILLGFSLPAALVSMMMAPTTWICNSILVRGNHGLTEMGILEAANQGRLMVLFVPGTVSLVFLPALSRFFASKQLIEFKRVFRVNILITVSSAVVVALPLIVFSKFIMGLYGNGFAEKGIILVLVSLAAVLKAVNDALIVVYYSINRVWTAFVFNFIWSNICIWSTYVMVHTAAMGAKGYAAALILSYIPHISFMILYLLYFFKKLDRSTQSAKSDSNIDINRV
ncbi:MAG: oligosaccharide flippase family protein [Clostridia bacterium]|nr:oligosaccharide flippase family protein [Clostridia bacterium]